jgi:ubiquinone/menaquinone biosynthesis C-methylase UbiE
MKQEKEEVLKQYADASNLGMRLQIHQLYSTNKQDFHHWVFEQMNLQPGSRIVEFGCGPGTFWLKNKDRLPENMDVTLTDLSSGMIKEAKENVDSFLHGTYKVMDIQDPEFESNLADVIICNHMLYHVPNLSKALSEVHRILKPTGRIIAATNGLRHMVELGEWLTEYYPNINAGSTDFMVSFALETGRENLEQYFSTVRLTRFESNLKVTNIDHLIAYYESMELGITLDNDFRRFLETKRMDGAFHITKDGGLFVAEK